MGKWKWKKENWQSRQANIVPCFVPYLTYWGMCVSLFSHSLTNTHLPNIQDGKVQEKLAFKFPLFPYLHSPSHGAYHRKVYL
ncbi:hypothetical protein IJ00_21815 [Calothrix sp. 336/3]|nr:hypothetical protein IJ00_21815 [Calothrix sp. 336/3]